jgi:hypothetical protein
MTDTTTPAQGTPPLKSEHLWPVVDSWGLDESDEPDSQRWVIKAMVHDLRVLKAELAESQAYALQLERALGEAWQPVPDGEVQDVSNCDDFIVSLNGSKITTWQERNGHYAILPPDIRLCRRTSSSPTAGE